MNTVVDIVIIITMICGVFLGMRKGLIKSVVNLVGLVLVFVISFSLKTPIANIMIENLPFFEFDGLSALSILVYNAIAFMIVFTVLYSILRIVLVITGIVDALLKLTVIWIIPSKIGGAIVGFFEALVFVFLALFIMTQFNQTNNLIKDNKMASTILNKMPVLSGHVTGIRDAASEIYEKINEYDKDDQKSKEDLNLYILQTEVKYKLISKEKAKELIETGKLDVKNAILGKVQEWLNP